MFIVLKINFELRKYFNNYTNYTVPSVFPGFSRIPVLFLLNVFANFLFTTMVIFKIILVKKIVSVDLLRYQSNKAITILPLK
jgi:hypothetical protein